MDTDAIAVKSFDPLLTYQAVLARDQGGFVVNGLIKFYTPAINVAS